MNDRQAVSGEEAPKHVINLREQIADLAMQQMIEVCAEYYHGYDMTEDAMTIAQLVICGEDDEDTAERILGCMGYIVSTMTYWKDLKPETVVRMKQICSLVLPGYYD
jgi:hypothetical protein